MLEYDSVYAVHSAYDPSLPIRSQPGSWDTLSILTQLEDIVDPATYDFVLVYSLREVPGWIDSGRRTYVPAKNIGLWNGAYGQQERTFPKWTRLRSVPHMNSVEFITATGWWSSPEEYGVLVAFHEMAHFWAVYWAQSSPGPREWKMGDPVAWLGAASSHWSWNWYEPGMPGILCSGPISEKFNAFDLYTMGLMHYLEASTFVHALYEDPSAGCAPTVPCFSGKLHDLRLADLIYSISLEGSSFFEPPGERVPQDEPSATAIKILPVVIKGRDDAFTPEQELSLRAFALRAPDAWRTATWERSTLEVAVPIPIVSLSSTKMSFGNQILNTSSAAQGVTLSNTGTATLTINSVSLVGTNPGDFAKASDGCSGVNVAPNNNCVISVTFRPTVEGPREATLSISHNASDSPHNVPLSGTGTPPVPIASMSPPNLSFANQLLNTTSSAQPVTVRNTGTAPLTITSIVTTGDYAQTNTCGSSVAAGASCVITVTFNPAATGDRSGTLTITDNDQGVAGSTQTVALTGNGTDFALSADPTSRDVAAGDSGSYTLSVTPVSGFNQPVTLGCTMPAQLTKAQCNLSSSSATPDGMNAATATVTITTTRSVNCSWTSPWKPKVAPPGQPISTRPTPQLVLWLIVLAMLAGFRASRRQLTPRIALLLSVVLVTLLIWASCGGGGVGPPPPPPCQPGTPAGTYTVTVTATSGGLPRSIDLTLKVN